MWIKILILLILTSSNVFAANFPLEITNIKPAGTGAPAIPATNRIFRAYPGIEYNIRAAVVGGLYPFTYSLSGQPSGMTINSSTGEISWPNPQISSGTITLAVTDAENTTVTTTWAITVSTSGFLFVDSNYVGTQTGSISQPYTSIASLLAGAGTDTNIVYFRGGNYQFLEYNNTGVRNMNLAGKPNTWLGYPSETVTMDGLGTGGDDGYCIRSNTVYIDNIRFQNFTNFAVVLWGGANYQTIRRSTFTTLNSNSSVNNNYGFIHSTGGGGTDFGYYAVIQDNEFSYFTGASAIGSLYSMNKLLIEDNYIHHNGGTGLPGFNTGISPKEWMNYLFVRHNRVIMTDYNAFGNPALNSTMVYSSNIDVSFNYFSRTNTGGQRGFIGSFNVYNSTKNFYFYRNTVTPGIALSSMNGSNCGTDSGPWTFNNNVIIDPNQAFSGVNLYNYFYYDTGSTSNNPQNCITDTNNLKGLPNANIIDASGNLIGEYTTYVGARGWQTVANPAVCGSANDGTFSSAPTTNLCTTGTASPVTGQYNWTCTADTVANCSASYSAEASTTTASPPGGTYTGTQSVSISCSGPCSSVQYCTTGASCTPSTNYTVPISVPATGFFRHRGSATDTIFTESYTINQPAGPTNRIYGPRLTGGVKFR